MTSDWASLSIVQPIGNDFAAFDFLKQQKNLSTFFESVDDESVQDLKNFINIFPESAYSDYVRYMLVSHYLLRKDNQSAEEQLRKLQQNTKFVFAKDVNEQLKKLQTNTQ